MGSSGMSAKLSDYVKTNYPDSKSDLFAVFIERCRQMVKKNGYQAMITQHAWMFLSSFEKLRAKLLAIDIVNMAHLGARAFEEIGGEVVQTTSFVIRKSHIADYRGEYCRLIEPTSQQGKEDMFLAAENRYTSAQDDFSKIPGSPVAYWKSSEIVDSFDSKTNLDQLLTFRQGMTTTDNEKYLRHWYEVSFDNIGFGLKTRQESIESKKTWFPYQKGGEYRKWYGNNDYVVYYYDDGKELIDLVTKKYPKISDPEFIIKNRNWYFKSGLTWSTLSTGALGVRYCDGGFIFDAKGSMAFTNGCDSIVPYIALLNSTVSMDYLDVLAPTMDFNIVALKAIPYLLGETNVIEALANKCIAVAKDDWDSFEASWNFSVHPLVAFARKTTETEKRTVNLMTAFSKWRETCDLRFEQQKANEETLNQLFIEAYGLQNELTPVIDDGDISIRKANLDRDIRSLISFAVGCMFGRYSLDEPGLAYAGGEWDANKYKTFLPDEDNCIPITDEEYFKDDIVGRLVEFVRTVYGSDTLEENLDFIANALGNKGNTSREIIRNYFLNDFIKDHIKTYQKRPIYWMFDSGKQNGFKALIYMHRYDENTIGRIRADYLFKMQRAYENELKRTQDTIDSSTNAREVAQAEKRKEKLTKQLKETRDYDQKIAHLALARISIDLDDGVKANYEKIQTAPDGKKLAILTPIK